MYIYAFYIHTFTTLIEKERQARLRVCPAISALKWQQSARANCQIKTVFVYSYIHIYFILLSL